MYALREAVGRSPRTSAGILVDDLSEKMSQYGSKSQVDVSKETELALTPTS